MPTVVDTLRQIGRPVNREFVAAACPRAVAYFGWSPAPPAGVTAAVATCPPAARCCPPTLPQRLALAHAGSAFQVCCADAAWAILPVTATATALQDAHAWLGRLYPNAAVLCTTITPGAETTPLETPLLARLHADLGPRPLLPRFPPRGTFTRRPPRFGTRGHCGGSCGAGAHVELSCDPTAILAFQRACSKPGTPSSFAETAWCVGYAQSHGVLGVRNCTNAAMGLGMASSVIAKPAPNYPICKDGKDMISCVTVKSGGAPGTEAYAADGKKIYENHVLAFPGGTLQDHAAAAAAFVAQHCGPNAPLTAYFTWAGQRVDIRPYRGGYLFNCGNFVVTRFDRNWTVDEFTALFYEHCAPKAVGVYVPYTAAVRGALYTQAATVSPPPPPSRRLRLTGDIMAPPTPGYQGGGGSPTAQGGKPTGAPWGGIQCGTKSIIFQTDPGPAAQAAWIAANCGPPR